MKKSILTLALISTLTLTAGETNATQSQVGVINKEQNAKHVDEQMKREEHYAKTQSFAQGDDFLPPKHSVG
jgi:hypothetical protein